MFRYVPHGNLFLALDQNLGRLCFLLARKRSPFNLRESSGRPSVRRLPPVILLPFRLARALGTMWRARYGGRGTFELPRFGNVAIRCRPSGYKYFDFRSGTVVVDAPMEMSSDAFEGYLANLTALGEAGVGPRVSIGSEGGRTYLEELVEGERVASVIDEWPRVAEPLAGFVEGLGRAGGENVVAVETLRTQLVEGLDSAMRALDAAGSFPHQARRIGAYYGHCMGRLERFDGTGVVAALTHGDFREKNFILRRRRVVAIDWITVARRSRLYDIYSIWFTALVHDTRNREGLRGKVFLRIHETAGRFAVVADPDGSKAAGIDGPERAAMLFMVFALEFLAVRLDYFVFPYEADDPFRQRMLDQICDYLDEFEHYEKWLAGARFHGTRESGEGPCAV